MPVKEYIFNLMSFRRFVDFKDTTTRFEILTFGEDEEVTKSLFMLEFENKRLTNLELFFFQVVP